MSDLHYATAVVQHLAEAIRDAGGRPDDVFDLLVRHPPYCARIARGILRGEPLLIDHLKKNSHSPISISVDRCAASPEWLQLPKGFNPSQWLLPHASVNRPKILSILLAGTSAPGEEIAEAVGDEPLWYPGSYVDMYHYLAASKAFPAYDRDSSVRFYALDGNLESKQMCYVAGSKLHICGLQEMIPEGSWISVWA
ncbi:MAG: hypothetical protein PHH13_03490 [Candidatus Peribacteraceae bacterium]|nr:hypothetical protein [Candidatus Peribacteraceae bacterium]